MGVGSNQPEFEISGGLLEQLFDAVINCKNVGDKKIFYIGSQTSIQNDVTYYQLRQEDIVCFIQEQRKHIGATHGAIKTAMSSIDPDASWNTFRNTGEASVTQTGEVHHKKSKPHRTAAAFKAIALLTPTTLQNVVIEFFEFYEKNHLKSRPIHDIEDKIRNTITSIYAGQPQPKDATPKDATPKEHKENTLALKTPLLISDDDWLSASNETAIPFIGREDELKALNDFAKGHPNKGQFQVWAVVGPSGTGKTRLLNHWANQIKRDGWAHIKVTPETKINWHGWTPQSPAVISIDYLYGYDEEIASIISNAQKTAFDHPVRLLLLDHATPNSMEALLRDPRWGFEDRGGDNFIVNEKPLFYAHAPLKLVVPDEDDETQLAKYDEFLTQVICAVVYKEKEKPTNPSNEPEIRNGLTYLQTTTGARHALFAALVGDAIRRKKEHKESTEDYFTFNRRDLIKHYFQGSNRLTWRLKGKDKKMGKWAACCIAAATAKRGANFRSLIHAMPNSALDAIEETEKFRSLCHSVVSGNDSVKLKPYEPDILGETFFLLFLEHCLDIEEYLPELIVSDKGAARERSAIEFVAFLTRLARNLSNDDQNASVIIQCWEQISDLLQSKAFANCALFRWASSMACFEIYLTLKGKGLRRKENTLYIRNKKLEAKASDFLSQVNPDDLYQPPLNILQADHVLAAFVYLGLHQERDQEPPKHVIELTSIWDDLEDDEYTSLMLAIFANNSLIAEMLINNGSNIIKKGGGGWTALMYACSYGQEKVALMLVERDANLIAQNNEGRTALMLACRYGQEAVALSLVEKGVGLAAQDHENWTALMVACRFDQKRVALALVEANANLEVKNNEGWTALMFACDCNQKELSLQLVDKEANLAAQNNKGWTALMIACDSSQEEVALALIEKEANLTAQDNENKTALMLSLSCFCYVKKVALALVEKDANLAAQDNMNNTALMYACCHRRKEIALALIERDANLPVQNDGGWTALMFACRYGQKEAALALVEKDAALTVKDINGSTALMVASANGQEEVVKALLEKKVDTDSIFEKDTVKATALGLARNAGHDEITEMLEAVGALEIPPFKPE
ncbi:MULTISPECIES: ankyrin repeat domain-containing protein [Pseudoalteromonas]|uniref:Orc1-like AAA ATPase domain-containing protein n=1 Tax=Pseudoalteromonas amylolytica TaxID=1859457 RepID=A0A1S1MY75_9GAMM|nr:MULTISPECIES: ankyrin repeat domain-containing protein [Pseudoalteromonas]OHU89202.1 hypothetical protein BFC16_06075 [Pseudoalteromonas sp. JW3]OHU92102.1 hypothetical protein BET10_07180 [Pseudoalteromonas amylolytica]